MSGNYTEAILTHQKALNSLGKTSEDYYWFLYELALDYAQINDWNLVYQTIKKSENKEVNSVLYAELFLTAKKNKEAHAFITEKLKFFPNSPRLNDMLSSLEKEKGTLKKNFYFNSRTLFEDLSESRESYEKFIRIASAANIPLLVMQYPTRALSPLLKMLQGVPMQQVYFLSNEAVFVDALQQKNYQELFYDHFGGSFGHLTKYGNFLLAENISKYLMTSHLLPKNICNH